MITTGYGGNFEWSQSMHGTISRVNVWDKVLQEAVISQLAKGADRIEGNIVPWSAFKDGIVGTVEIVAPSECTLPGNVVLYINDFILL